MNIPVSKQVSSLLPFDTAGRLRSRDRSSTELKTPQCTVRYGLAEIETIYANDQDLLLMCREASEFELHIHLHPARRLGGYGFSEQWRGDRPDVANVIGMV